MNFKRRKQLISKATLILIAIGFFVLQVDAQNQSEQIEVPGETARAWVANGELIRFRAFNPSQTVSGRPNESISVQLKAFDEHGVLLRETPTVVIQERSDSTLTSKLFRDCESDISLSKSVQLIFSPHIDVFVC